MNIVSNQRRTLGAALTLICMTAGSTATSSLFVIYRHDWGITSADIAIAFTAYVGTLLPTLLFFGGLAERYGRRAVIRGGIASMALGLLTLTLAHSLPLLILARLFQGAGVGLSIGAVSAAFAESYRGRLPQGNALQSITAVGLFAGPVVSAVAYHFGAGLNGSFVPGLISVVSLFAFSQLIAEPANDASVQRTADTPLPDAEVVRGLRFAMPLVFVSWAGLSMYLSLVPAYLAAELHAVNPLIGAAAIVAAQLSSLIATLVLGGALLQRSGIVAPVVTVAGLALLVTGTSFNAWPLVAISTVLVGAGGGIASAAAFGIANRVGRGQRARVFGRMFVAAYLGYSVPVLAIGMIAVHASLAVGFIVAIAGLTAITAALPFVREAAVQPTACPRAAVATA
jgi:MFS family permease